MYAMPACPNCGKHIEVDTTYCPRCGEVIPVRDPQMCECPRCGGKGKVPWKVGGFVMGWNRCPKCKGKREVRCSGI